MAREALWDMGSGVPSDGGCCKSWPTACLGPEVPTAQLQGPGRAGQRWGDSGVSEAGRQEGSRSPGGWWVVMGLSVEQSSTPKYHAGSL